MVPKRDTGPKTKPNRTSRSPTAGRSNIVRSRLHVRPPNVQSSPPPTPDVQDNQARPEQQSPQQTSIQLYNTQQAQIQREIHQQRPRRRRNKSLEEQENMDTPPSLLGSNRPSGSNLLPSSTPQSVSALNSNTNRVSFRLNNIPPYWSLLNLYQIFEEYGQIDFLELYEDNFGKHNGRGKIVFG